MAEKCLADFVGRLVLSGDDPVALATAILGSGTTSTGVGTTPVAGFPTNGSSFGIITSGNAAFADDPNDDAGSGRDWLVSASAIGPGVCDNQIVRIDLGAATGNCLAFDFEFLSEEYPEYVNSGFNDAFIAQLNSWAVTRS